MTDKYARRYTKEEIDFVCRNFRKMNYMQLEAAFRNRFGYYRSGKTLQRKAYNLGMRKQRFGENDSWFKKGRVWEAEVKQKVLISRFGIIDYILKGYL